MNLNVLGAVFRRNFFSYFANPTGYVFICVFVLLSGFAAFWPNEFFNANLANLDQLSKAFPFIMLIFIPAITMAVWSDERRQGTDELLLTIPAQDIDIVLGKYLAALAVFSVSLVFSAVCNYAVLRTLGDPDPGLFASTYVGYWFIGMAMLAVGMVASFLSGNLTVSYILGALFSAPLVFAMFIEPFTLGSYRISVKEISLGENFRDFGRGVISLSSIAYFVMIVAVMLYLCMILIGRRHWLGGRGGESLLGHYIVRTVALVAIACGATWLFTNHDGRLDISQAHLSSLSPETTKLLADLDLKRPVQVEAFISPTVPEQYVQTRLNLLNMLRELKARGGAKVQVTIVNTEPRSEEAARAEQRYGIMPRRVNLQAQGRFTVENLFMGVAFTCGLEKVIIPFIDRGISVEYELVRSICTVSQQNRKRIGILTTDAQLYGQFNMQTMSSSGNWPIIDELEKQYELVQVDPTNPITEKYDALLAVQPSSLGPEQMENFIRAVENGQPTAIFEDPMPALVPDVPGTSAPRQSPGMNNPMMAMMGGGQRNQPKGDLGRLWRILGVDFAPDQIVWQNYNPYPKIDQFNRQPEFVFVDKGESKKSDPFNEKSRVSSKLQQLLFPFPGAVTRLQASNLEFTPLVKTGDRTGTVSLGDVFQTGPFGNRMGFNENRPLMRTANNYVLAAQIKGKIRPADLMADDKVEAKPEPKAAAKPAAKPAEKPAEKPAAKAEAKPAAKPQAKPEAKPDAKPEAKAEAKPVAKTEMKADAKADAAPTEPAAKSEPAAKAEPAKPQEVEINVVVVADIDMLSRPFFALREQGDQPELGVDFRFDNVPFVLNILDLLAGDQRFMEIRKRRPEHRTLTKIEDKTEDFRNKAALEREQFLKEFKASLDREKKALADKLDEIKKRKNVNPMELAQELEIAQETGNARLEASTAAAERKRDQQMTKIETDLALEIRAVQSRYKIWAVVLPPILPLLIGLGVLVTRRAQEREGVSRSRLRS